MPYSAFRLAHPPLTFLMQALLIRVFGPYYVFPMLYTSIASGAATVLAYQIARRLLRDVVSRPDVLAAVLCVPLVTIGIYAIFPHPHYDPDSALATLAALAAVFFARERPTPRRWLIAGALLVVPLFVKQNIGGAFLPPVLGVLAVDAIADRSRVRDVLWCLAGVAVALATAVGLIQLLAGLNSYVTWTITYAMAERGVLLDRYVHFADTRSIAVGLLMPVVAIALPRVPPRLRMGTVVAVIVLPLTVIVAITTPLIWVPLLVSAAALAHRRAGRAARLDQPARRAGRARDVPPGRGSRVLRARDEAGASGSPVHRRLERVHTRGARPRRGPNRTALGLREGSSAAAIAGRSATGSGDRRPPHPQRRSRRRARSVSRIPAPLTDATGARPHPVSSAARDLAPGMAVALPVPGGRRQLPVLGHRPYGRHRTVALRAGFMGGCRRIRTVARRDRREHGRAEPRDHAAGLSVPAAVRV